jgi:hypothetical protein
VANLTLRFRARGEPGAVDVEYSLNGDPGRWGFDILGLEGDVSRAAAFPIFEASVRSSREGYAALFGWVQVVHYWSAHGDEPEWSLLDNPPQLRGLGVPFFTWGLEPRMFDAPLDTPAGIVRWQALTFLSQTPDGLMARTVEPLVGLTWGYLIDNGQPKVLPVARATQDEWQRVKSVLEAGCPAWTFGDNLQAPTG